MAERRDRFHAAAVAGLVLFGISAGQEPTEDRVKLPEPSRTGTMSVEQALASRRSVRRFSDAALSLEEVGQLLWAAQGVTAPRGRRTAPSAGATYPLECLLAAGSVSDLEPGLYRYLPDGHELLRLSSDDVRDRLSAAALNQVSVRTAPASIVICAEYARTRKRYGERAERYVQIEVGHCAENVHLQCEALGLGTVCIGAFDDARLKELLDVAEEPLYIMPFGHGAEE
jgi:SagB-type dehydrogenase family enzyme